jgi:rSAM/selenodomain-associated transferase 2
VNVGRENRRMSRPDISIVIPVLNEAGGIVRALEHLQEFRARGAEIIVVDGGSDDDTVLLALPLADCVTAAARGRGAQMNAGARRASGGVLLFLHADTQLPPSATDLIDAAIADGARWGRFDVRIDGLSGALALVAFMMNWRSRLTGIATGDQAIFVTREAFQASGEFPAIPLMEDIVFSGSLRRIARPACLREKVTTSGRHWEKRGLLRTILTMWWLRLRFHFGANPDDLAREYGYAVRKN